MSIISILSTIFIGPLKLLFEVIYTFASREIGNYGLAIIFLSLAMNILVLPLYKRADIMQRESHDMETKLHDGVAHIKSRFSGDERMMILQTYYRQNNYSPLSVVNGSISLLLQIPFFIAAYQFLSGLIVIKGVSFGPIEDLGAPDGMIVIGGIAINVLPILMTLINFISSTIYSKGYPIKTKIQLYAMATFFLIFLYKSPSGLVFYWTLNNLFSLVKTIFYKLKNAKKILRILISAIGVGIGGYGIIFADSFKSKFASLLVAVLFQVPILFPFIKSKLPEFMFPREADRKLFLLGSTVLAILMGLLIPSNVIGSSPQEFVDITAFYNPLWTIVNSLAYAVGVFLVWLQVFYALSSKSVKAVFDKVVWIACCVTIVNYMFFGTDLGTLSNTLKYDNMMLFSFKDRLVNLTVIFIIAVVAYLIVLRWRKVVVPVLLVAAIAIGGLSGKNMISIQKSVNVITQTEIDTSDDNAYFTLSQNGKNVVVIFLDRAIGEFVPYILKEKPELKEKFAGFTYYDNVISFAVSTKQALPALLGGYEYTPVEMNKRDKETLVSKHNEAVKMMPVLFNNNGFKTTVADPVYANYNLFSDLSIFDDYPEINSFVSINRFKNSDAQNKSIRTVRAKNMFSFSVTKSMPLLIQPTLYNDGLYNQALTQDNVDSIGNQNTIGISKANGNRLSFIKPYEVLNNLSDFVKISNSDENTFFFLANDTTHEPTLLQTPDYTPEKFVDNTEYDSKNTERFFVDGKSLIVNREGQMSHYHVNVAALMRIGEWLDFLRENNVYDNTRIIIAADHGLDVKMQKELLVGEDLIRDCERYYPLLMVKDFDSKEFKVSSEFMTNADVPTLATKDIINNPTNPFTGKLINNSEKTAHKQYISTSYEWDVNANKGNTFLPSQWLSVEDNIWVKDNWKLHEKETVLKEHKIYENS